jgi:hypothetical protein
MTLTLTFIRHQGGQEMSFIQAVNVQALEKGLGEGGGEGAVFLPYQGVCNSKDETNQSLFRTSV